MRSPSAAQLRRALKASNLTQQEAADALGLSLSGFKKYLLSDSDERREMSPATWHYLLLLTDQHPTHRLVKRRKS